MRKKTDIFKLLQLKKEKKKITMLTAYNFWMANLLQECEVDLILVGDSVGMVELGYEDTLKVTLDEMLHHTKAVCRGAPNTFVIADMPFLTYKVNVKDAVYNAGRLIKEGGASAVKLEGGREVSETVKALIQSDIPVMGHIGLTPQSILRLGGYKVQGTKKEEGLRLKEDAFILAEAGVFGLVLECIPWNLAKEITEEIPIPTIGIGAGPFCDGQVLVTEDLLGLYVKRKPKFVKRFASLNKDIKEAISTYIKEVRSGTFPSMEESYEAYN
jgi:3-methyl-2-oxobutanoate hydroxymethyltransferase